MRILQLFFCLAVSIISFGQKNTIGNSTQPQTRIKLSNVSDSVQYVLGSYVAQWINSNGFKLSNPTLFNRALDDFFQKRPRAIPDSLVPLLFEQYELSSRKENAVKQEQQLFSGLKDKPGIGMFPNGVRYIILKAGQGMRPAAKDSIIVHMVAKLPDNTVVEDTYRTQKPFSAIPDSFFPALSDALQMMTGGSKWQLYIPAALAYGEKGTANIPPNSALILDVELVDIKSHK